MDGQCVLNGTTFNNCTAACLDPGLAFYSLQTVVQCFFNHPASSSSTINHFVYPGDSAADPTCSISTGPAMTSMFDACMQQYCRAPDSDLGGCPYNTTRGLCSSGSNFATCANISQIVNSDLGGVGVFVSYLMQVSIVMAAWFLLELLGPWMKALRRLTLSISRHIKNEHQRPKEDEEKLVKHARDKKKWSLFSDQQAVLKSMLVEFQEAQCFFMLASQAAVLMTVPNGPIIFGAKSLSQLTNNYRLVGIITLGGAVPVTFVLFTLSRFDMFSWYILGFSGITLSISTAATMMLGRLINMPFERSDLQPVAGTNLLDACGGNPPPAVYCNRNPLAIGVGVIPLWCSWAVYLIVVSRAVFRLLSQNLRVQRFFKQSKPQLFELLSSNRMHKIIRWASATLTLLVYGNFIVLLTSLYDDLFGMSRTGSISMHNWSLGQIVSVTIWAPVLFKYIYASIFGLKGHSSVRIAKPYEIRNTEEDQVLCEEWPTFPQADNQTYNPAVVDGFGKFDVGSPALSISVNELITPMTKSPA